MATFNIHVSYFDTCILADINYLSSRLLSKISWGIPEISTFFLLLYCSAFAWLFSNSITRFSSKVLTFFTTIKWLLCFSFDSLSFARFSDKQDTWSQKVFNVIVNYNFPFNFSILLTRSCFFIALISLNDNSKRFAVLLAITINKVLVEESKISLEHQ